MSYNVLYGVGADKKVEFFETATELRARLVELGVTGDFNILPPGNAVWSEEWVKTDHDPEWGDLMQVEWYWVTEAKPEA